MKTALDKQFVFPCGEPHLQVKISQSYSTEWEFTGAQSILELMLYGDAVTRIGSMIGTLTIPYVPFGRQDRVNTQGEPLSIAVMAKIINDLHAERVVITDPHSDVTPALINNCVVIPQHEVFKRYFPLTGKVILISPDGGALKKIYHLAKLTGLDVIECSKKRNVKTGEIIGTTVPVDDLTGLTCVIVDDICDGGHTFVGLSKVLWAHKARKVILMVTHGFFTKGLQVFDGLIDEIYTRKGRVK